MELDQLIDEMYTGKTTKFEGIVVVKDIAIQLSSDLRMTEEKKVVIVNVIMINKTNIAMTCTYIIDASTDDKNKVMGDFESLVAYMHFGVDKVAKPIVPTE